MRRRALSARLLAAALLLLGLAAATAATHQPTDAHRPVMDRAQGFTLADVDAGRVDPEVYDTFWRGEVIRIRTAPCPTQQGLVLFVGADGDGDRYRDWTPDLHQALQARTERCNHAR